MSGEPPEVAEARALIKRYELRHGHDSYVEPLDGGHKGYRAQCWNCDWVGPEHLRGSEEMGTPESREHKANARYDAVAHQAETRPDDWRRA